jgi:hypothetical protein
MDKQIPLPKMRWGTHSELDDYLKLMVCLKPTFSRPAGVK